MGLYGLGNVAVGVLAFAGDPSPGLVNTLGYDVAVYAYSGLLVALGLGCTVGIWLGNRKAAVDALLGIALATVVHGITLMTAGGLQTGLRLLVAPLMMVPGAIAWRHWMALRSVRGDE